MAEPDTPCQDSAVDTPSENDQSSPHVVLTGSREQPEYVQLLEKRLQQLEEKVQELLAEKEKPEKTQNDETENVESESNRSDNEESAEKQTEKTEEQEEENEKKETDRTIIAKAQKLNYINFSNRFPTLTEVPVVEAMMVDTTISAAEEEDHDFTNKVTCSSTADGLKAIQAKIDSNSYKPDAWMARIRINSGSLVKEIMSILSPNQEFGSSLTFYYPFPALMQHHSQIKERFETMKANPMADNMTETSSHEDEARMLSYFETYIHFMETEVIPLDPRKRTKVRFPALSAIFNLGDSIYVPDAGKSTKPNPEKLGQRNDQRLWRLYRTQEDADQDEGKFILKCYVMDHDGETYVCMKKTFEIRAFSGEQEVSSLPVFPLQYAENAEQIRTECRAQGQIFLHYLDERLVSHNGWALDPDPDESHSPLQYVTSDVIIDMTEGLKAHPNHKPEGYLPKARPRERPLLSYNVWVWDVYEEMLAKSYERKTEDYWQHEYTRMEKIKYCTETDPFLSSWNNGQTKAYKPQGSDLELLPRRLFAYVLQDRKFVAVDIQNLKPVEDNWSRSASLIIDKDHEDMLRALVDSHFKRKFLQESLGVYSTNQDIISSKGRGLIILLYGVPGVGKTSTAENIAHSWNRPLLPITCGDLGTLLKDVEKNLKDIFRLAQLWDCILLLDEADVFLSERTPAALERNALVSVFLRMLEYYTGILFLTTNLPGSIDEAFKSRIHISLYYPHLSKDTTMKIWDMNLTRLARIEAERAEAKKQPPLTIDLKGIKRFAKRHYRQNEDGKGRWNGRQIRNAFLIASALAHFEKHHPTASQNKAGDSSKDSNFDIKPRHFEVIADASLGFERYLLETRGRSAGENAFQRGLRADYILSAPQKLEETPYAPRQNSNTPGKSFGDPFPATNPPWTTPTVHHSGGHDPGQRWRFNEDQLDAPPVYQGMAIPPVQQFSSQHQAHRVRSSASKGTPPQHMDFGPQGSPSPWNVGKQPSYKGHSSSFPGMKENSDTEYDSDSQ